MKPQNVGFSKSTSIKGPWGKRKKEKKGKDGPKPQMKNFHENFHEREVGFQKHYLYFHFLFINFIMMNLLIHSKNCIPNCLWKCLHVHLSVSRPQNGKISLNERIMTNIINLSFYLRKIDGFVFIVNEMSCSSIPLML
jgi:hypothetical protein